ncbi:MAG: DHH family phosphoesterase [Nanoarchaeota archaeon]|nr:DHH family phosphoesterase [Nanoarchaeota archaeon]
MINFFNFFNYWKFLIHIRTCTSIFKEAIADKKKVKVISHYDSDGISAAAILVNAFERKNLSVSYKILPYLSEEDIISVSKEDFSVFVFADFGAAHINHINKNFKQKEVFVIDHHKGQEVRPDANVHVMNPHDQNIDSSRDISASGVAYLFSEALNKINQDMAHIALIGAVGDVQEKSGFHGINKKIYRKAIRHSLLTKKKDLKFYGADTKSLAKLLAHSNSPLIPGITGSTPNAEEFLKSLGIINGNDFTKKLGDLTASEKLKLVDSISERIGKKFSKNSLYANKYYFVEEPAESPIREIRQFSTFLNASGRLGRPDVGINACIRGIKPSNANRLLKDYRNKITDAIHWYNNNKGTKRIIHGKRYIVIDTEKSVLYTIIGTLCSIVSTFSEVQGGTIIVVLGEYPDNMIKISARISGKNIFRINLYNLFESSCANIPDADFGGHRNAAGAMIPIGSKDEFINKMIDLVSK